MDLTHQLFKDFDNRLNSRDFDQHAIEVQINKIRNPFHQKVMKSIHLFNQAVVKTNLYIQDKSAIIYQLNPEICLTNSIYIEKPRSIYMMNGTTFSGM